MSEWIDLFNDMLNQDLTQVFHSNHTKEETLLRIAAYLQGSFR